MGNPANIPAVREIYKWSVPLFSSAYCGGNGGAFSVRTMGSYVEFKFDNYWGDIIERPEEIAFKPRHALCYKRDYDDEKGTCSQWFSFNNHQRNYIVGALDCALSQETDPTKQKALKSIRDALTAARIFIPD